jgi:hypothetical protein
MTDQAQIDQIKADVEALQAASAAAADQIAVLTDQILGLQEGQITDEQIDNLHKALAAVTAELTRAVEESQAALGGGAQGEGGDENEQREREVG